MSDFYVVAVIVLVMLEIFTIGFVVGFWFAEKMMCEQEENAK